MYVVAEMKPCVCGKFNYQARGLRFFQDHKVKKKCFPLWCYHTNLLILHCLLVFRWLQYIQHLWRIQPV